MYLQHGFFCMETPHSVIIAHLVLTSYACLSIPKIRRPEKEVKTKSKIVTLKIEIKKRKRKKRERERGWYETPPSTSRFVYQHQPGTCQLMY